MESSSYRKPNSRSAGQEFPYPLWNPKFHKGQSLVPILSHVHITSHFLKIRVHIFILCNLSFQNDL